MEVAAEVCGRTKGNPRHSHTCLWCNDELAELISEKRHLFRIFDCQSMMWIGI